MNKYVYGSIPKAGSTYVINKLSQGAGLQIQYGDGGPGYLDYSIVPPNSVIKTHCTPAHLIDDLKILGANKVVYTIREPRQMALSALHFISYNMSIGAHEKMWQDDGIPMNFHKLSMKEKIPIVFDLYLNPWISQMDQWLNFDSSTIRCQIMKFEDFQKDQLSFFKDLVSFYGIKRFNYEVLNESLPASKNGKEINKYNFRKGSTDEFEFILTPEQNKRYYSYYTSSLQSLYSE